MNDNDIEVTERHILQIKTIRQDAAALIDCVENLSGGKSRETSLAITKLQEARHWLGEELGRLHKLGYGKPAYPRGNDTSTTEIDPPADVEKQ